MSTEIEDSKRVVKNTMVLYVRMFFTMALGFYMSRVILLKLGIEDYGIYNVVGGVASMFSFLNSSLSGATSRFLTFNLGQGNLQKMKDTFSAAYTIHIFLAIIIVILCETIGLWLLENKLVIPEARMSAARILFQLSVFATMVSIIQVPFNALIISHEKMNVFAYFSMLDIVLKLIAVFILDFIPFDNLIVYGVLFFLTNNFIMFLNRWYAKRHFTECVPIISHDGRTMRPMLKFSGWDLYGNLSVMGRTQGVNILENMFFGPVVNAAAGVSGYVMNAILGFSSNFITAVRPQIIKLYAKSKIEEMQRLVERSSKMAFFLLFFVSFPCLLELQFVLEIWLEEVPDYASDFIKLTLLFNWINVLFFPLTPVIHATGNVKRISIINGTLYLLVVPITYFIFKYSDSSPLVPYLFNALFVLLGCLINLHTVKILVPNFNVRHYLKYSISRAIISVLVGGIIPLICFHRLASGWLPFLIVCSLCVVCNGLSILYIGLTKGERIYLYDIIGSKIRHIFSK